MPVRVGAGRTGMAERLGYASQSCLLACWAGGPGASALREGGLTGSPDECSIRACGSAVTGPAASAGPDPFCVFWDCALAAGRRNAPSRVPPSPPACAPGRERDGRQRCRTAGVMTSPGGIRCWRRRCRSPVKATEIIRSLHRRRRSGGPGSRRWCVSGCRSRGAAGGPGSGSGCGGRPCADDVPGLGEIGDDAVGLALGDARPGRDVAQPHARVAGDAQQHPGVIGQDAPVRHARKLM
jgi:hypothetical protein